MTYMYIVAGNKFEFDAFVRRKAQNPTGDTYRYVSSPDVLRGLCDVHGLYIGTYLKRPDIEEIKDMIAISQYKTYIKPLASLSQIYGKNAHTIIIDEFADIIKTSASA